MTSNHNLGGNYWGYLIKKDKSATPLLEQLCLGLAKIIGDLEPGSGHDTELTPQRLAAFYRSVGGNYDSLFLRSSDSGLSFVYKTLGCLHSLQPSWTAFETPCVPALKPAGFVRWQTLQLLLLPNEHVPFMQEAVKRYDVPRPGGGFFPKTIPKEAFPDKPDKAMEDWHNKVTGGLEQQMNNTRRIKNSPFASPRDPPHRGDSYFLSTGKLSQARRFKGSHSPEYDTTPIDDTRRRSSVPDIVSPFPPPTDHKHRASDAQQYPSPPNSRSKPSQYNSPHRTSNASARHRPSDTSSARHRYSNSSHRTSNSSTTYRPVLSSSAESNDQLPPTSYPNGRHAQRSASGSHHPPPRSPSTIDESSSGSEASSENSQAGRGQNSHEARDDRRRSSLFPPNPFKHHLRRHSHDATYLPNGKPPLPPRPNGNSSRTHDPSSSAKPEYAYKNTFAPSPAVWNGNSNGNSNIQFRDNVFDKREDAHNSAPESPGFADSMSPKNPKMRYFDPMGNSQLVRIESEGNVSREGSGASGADRERAQRKSGMPLRISTVSGVGGRRYAAVEPRTAFVGNTKLSPKQLGVT